MARNYLFARQTGLFILHIFPFLICYFCFVFLMFLFIIWTTFSIAHMLIFFNGFGRVFLLYFLQRHTFLFNFVSVFMTLYLCCVFYNDMLIISCFSWTNLLISYHPQHSHAIDSTMRAGWIMLFICCLFKLF